MSENESGSLTTSVFAMCEAARQYSSETFIYAIDLWQGDNHTGKYGSEVFDKVRSHWVQTHKIRSRLIKSSFDKALSHFPINSIDLLHIDGLHTYEAVKEDYESWLPKMRNTNIIAFILFFEFSEVI